MYGHGGHLGPDLGHVTGTTYLCKPLFRYNQEAPHETLLQLVQWLLRRFFYINIDGHLPEPRHEISNNVVSATTKAQTSLHVWAVWSEPLLVAWIFYDCLATDWPSFRISKLNRRHNRLIWVYTCQNASLLEISCLGSPILWPFEKWLLFQTVQHVTGSTNKAIIRD